MNRQSPVIVAAASIVAMASTTIMAKDGEITAEEIAASAKRQRSECRANG